MIDLSNTDVFCNHKGKSSMTVTHTNRRGDTYYLLQGLTKTVKPKYYVSKKPGANTVEQIPDGFELYESWTAAACCRFPSNSQLLDKLLEVHHNINTVTLDSVSSASRLPKRQSGSRLPQSKEEEPGS